MAIDLPPIPQPTWQRTGIVLAAGLSLWWIPVIGVGFWLGWEIAPARQGLFFSKAAQVTFGGAYAVLPYVAQQAVENFQCLSNLQMMNGLALAETTPGPLIMVLQFVGLLGAWQNPGILPPFTAALAGSAITTWVTFLPSFVFVFLGAPWIEKISNFPKLSAALAAITACVTGVILNLGVVFAETAFLPESGGIDWLVASTAVIAFAALRKFRIPFAWVIAAAGLAGLLAG